MLPCETELSPGLLGLEESKLFIWKLNNKVLPTSDGLYDSVPGALPLIGLAHQAAHFFRRWHGSDFTLG